MLVGAILLGHIRPTWMELDYVLPCAGGGLFFGALLGLITGRGTTDEATTQSPITLFRTKWPCLRRRPQTLRVW